jgi:hypothetical protein
VPHRALSTRNGILGHGDRAAEIAARDDTRLQRLKGGQTGRGNPGTNGMSEPERKSPGSERLDGGDRMDRDWMPTTQSIERVSGQSQEREFSMQRQGDKIGQFDAASRAETAQAK